MGLMDDRYIAPGTSQAYEEAMMEKYLPNETVSLPHGATGHWIGKKDAKNVVVYYHGTSTSTVYMRNN